MGFQAYAPRRSFPLPCFSRVLHKRPKYPIRQYPGIRVMPALLPTRRDRWVRPRIRKSSLRRNRRRLNKGLDALRVLYSVDLMHSAQNPGVEIVSMDATAALLGVKRAKKRTAGQANRVTTCLTEDNRKRPFPHATANSSDPWPLPRAKPTQLIAQAGPGYSLPPPACRDSSRPQPQPLGVSAEPSHPSRFLAQAGTPFHEEALHLGKTEKKNHLRR